MCVFLFFRLLLVGGCESGDDSASKASCCGITAWRALSGSPHYKQVTSYEDDVSMARSHTCTHVFMQKNRYIYAVCNTLHILFMLESEKRFLQDSQF